MFVLPLLYTLYDFYNIPGNYLTDGRCANVLLVVNIYLFFKMKIVHEVHKVK